MTKFVTLLSSITILRLCQAFLLPHLFTGLLDGTSVKESVTFKDNHGNFLKRVGTTNLPDQRSRVLRD